MKMLSFYENSRIFFAIDKQVFLHYLRWRWDPLREGYQSVTTEISGPARYWEVPLFLF